MVMGIKSDPEVQGEYIVREVYRNLIKEKKKQGKDTANLERRLHKLEGTKCGELIPGVPSKRRL